jgi:hypothetical protein
LPEKLSKRFDISLDAVARLRKAAQDHAHFVELFLTDYARRRGKSRWGEKTPQNVRHLVWIFQHWPAAKFIHILRDGRDAVCSIRTHPRFRMLDGAQVPTGILRPLEPCIRAWLHDTAAGLAWRGHANCLEVRYEDLVNEPEAILRKVCAFIGEDFDPALLRYHEQERDATNFITNVAATKPLKTTAVGRWRTDLKPDELQLFQTLAGARQVELGYD